MVKCLRGYDAANSSLRGTGSGSSETEEEEARSSSGDQWTTELAAGTEETSRGPPEEPKVMTRAAGISSADCVAATGIAGDSLAEILLMAGGVWVAP
jgi:hypothetical protein